jgi:hypothetical protein
MDRPVWPSIGPDPFHRPAGDEGDLDGEHPRGSRPESAAAQRDGAGLDVTGYDDAGDDRFSVPCQAPAFPELYADLDLALLSASDDYHRWQALIGGTREVLDRFAYCADPATPVGKLPSKHVLKELRAAVGHFAGFQAGPVAHWLDGIVGIAAAHDELHDRCVENITAALDHGHDAAVAAIIDAAASLDAAAQQVATMAIPPPPRYVHHDPGQLRVLSLYPLGVEIRRDPLSERIAGLGGLAATPEFNPYIAALYALELATHRRFYRLFFLQLRAAGADMTDETIFRDPDLIDREPIIFRRWC